MKQEQDPYPTHLYRRKKTNITTAKKQNKTKISHQPISYQSNRGHKIEGAKPKQTRNGNGWRKNKQGDSTQGNRRESSLQRTSSPGKDSEKKTKKQRTATCKTRRTGTSFSSAGYARKQERQPYKQGKTTQKGSQGRGQPMRHTAK